MTTGTGIGSQLIFIIYYIKFSAPLPPSPATQTNVASPTAVVVSIAHQTLYQARQYKLNSERSNSLIYPKGIVMSTQAPSRHAFCHSLSSKSTKGYSELHPK